MFKKSVNYEMQNLDDFVNQYILPAAQTAVSEGSYGVGGALINLKTGDIIKVMHNSVIATENTSEKNRLKDPTAHGERQLVDWYFANKIENLLPEPNDILLVTSLDPCLMCTGSILSTGFKVAVVALDDNAGINWDNSYTFRPLEGKVLENAKSLFIYPVVQNDPSRKGYGTVPLFNDSVLSTKTDKDCFDIFVEGANLARSIVHDIYNPSSLIDIELSTAENNEVRLALLEEYPLALQYKAKIVMNPTTESRIITPDVGLAPFLIEAANEDLKNGGDGDAVAFLDYFGNLLMCKPGMKNESPIRSAFMETARAYQKIRYKLSANSNENLKYLCDPSLGSFIFVKGFDKSAPSFADIGAFGSVMLNTPQGCTLQYLIERISHESLEAYINGMPKRYADTVKPVVVTDSDLIEKVKNNIVMFDK